MEAADGLWLLGPAADGAFVEGGAADVVRAIFDACGGEPVTRTQIVERVLAAAGGEASAGTVVSDAIDLLLRMGTLIEVHPPRPVAPPGTIGHVLVGITGAIGAIQAPGLVQVLLAAGHDVRVMMTGAARRFITPRAFEALTHRAVLAGIWSGSPSNPAPHIEAARWADVVVVDPCSATTLSRIAAGDCSELVAAVATTARAPVLLVPSMNPEMLRSASVQDNLATCIERGFFVARAGGAIEVADVPSERALTGGGAAPPTSVLRFVTLLLERARTDAPRLPSAAEWDVEHTGYKGDPDAPDPELDALLRELAPAPVRLLDLGTGLGAVARAAARLGHRVIAVDSSPGAIQRAARVAPELSIAWLVDDVTDSRLKATFDVCVDRACLGCLPVARRSRYLAQLAEWIAPGGLWILKVHRASPAHVRAHGFELAELEELARPSFELLRNQESVLRFGAAGERPALTLVLRRTPVAPAVAP
jgi:3-polyprenyl-4-hydroxybenzoate decarboxylase/SAM-dependent methyltransferase